jgi:hypothetical protein
MIMPTYEEICTLCAYKSKNAAFKLVKRLMDAGYIVKVGYRIAPGPKFFID